MVLYTVLVNQNINVCVCVHPYQYCTVSFMYMYTCRLKCRSVKGSNLFLMWEWGPAHLVVELESFYFMVDMTWLQNILVDLIPWHPAHAHTVEFQLYG